jgi:hypothetical protein
LRILEVVRACRDKSLPESSAFFPHQHVYRRVPHFASHILAFCCFVSVDAKRHAVRAESRCRPYRRASTPARCYAMLLLCSPPRQSALMHDFRMATCKMAKAGRRRSTCHKSALSATILHSCWQTRQGCSNSPWVHTRTVFSPWLRSSNSAQKPPMRRPVLESVPCVASYLPHL